MSLVLQYIFSTCTGSALIFVASILFPRFFRYHVIIAALLGQRRHRSHFSFMSRRRMDQICGNGQQWYTVFVMGLKSRSLPVQAGPSRRSGQSKYTDSTRMEDPLAAEALNEYGEPERAKTSVKRKRKAKKQVNSDPEDEDFATSDGSESEDSEIEIVMTNEEIAASLPSRTLPKNAERAAKPQPPKKKPRKKDNPPAVSANSANACPAPPAEGPSTRKQQRGGKRNVIYIFFEDVDTDADGTVVDGSCYYKCYLGNREIIEVPKSANYNISKLRKHLEATSKLTFDCSKYSASEASLPPNWNATLLKISKL
ncbi:hypothetical protein B0H14DRAFT_2591173 [Mycena olivaceomarginata]|nr:hypothetical protein B0H14DRAFT_2591173 [Mycena olivaceomarginata]